VGRGWRTAVVVARRLETMTAFTLVLQVEDWPGTSPVSTSTYADLPRFLDRPVDPDFDHLTSPAEAPFILVEYGDFECPFCARATGVAAELRDRFGGSALCVPPSALGRRAPARRACRTGGRGRRPAGRFWEMHDLLFAHQDELGFEDVVGYASDLRLDIEQFLRDPGDETPAERASAEASGARGTPTFFVGDARHTGAHDTATLASALEQSASAKA